MGTHVNQLSQAELNRIQSIFRLYDKPLPSARTGPLYNAFSYPTKISPEAIALFIATHTQPGDTVIDTFAGSGTTGIAAKLCDKPTPEMQRIVSEYGVAAVWGPRNAVLYELSTIGSFVSDVMCTPPVPQIFEREAKELISAAYERLSPLLIAHDELGEAGILRHVIWSEMLRCANCGHDHTFFDVAVQYSPLRLRGQHDQYKCPGCGTNLTLATVGRVTERVYDELLNREIETRKRVPVRVYGKTGKRKWQRPFSQADQSVLDSVADTIVPPRVPVAELKLADLYRSGYHFGMTHLHHLYTRRNLISLGTIFELIEDRDPSVRDALRLLALSYNQSHSTLMTRVVVKDGGHDFVLTGAQSGVLYVSSLPVEKNVLEGVARKIKHFSESFALVRDSRSVVTVKNKSSTSLDEDDASFDYVFTDPPFGDYIPYSEINQINELWLGKRTDSTHEAIMSNAQGKTVEQYASLMGAVFSEISRVLKPGGTATVVFHSAKASVWSALQAAYSKAGMFVAATSVLDKLQASFKQVVSSVSVRGDPLILLTKTPISMGVVSSHEDGVVAELIARATKSNDPSEKQPERLYSRYVADCLERREKVGMDADIFYTLLRETVSE